MVFRVQFVEFFNDRMHPTLNQLNLLLQIPLVESYLFKILRNDLLIPVLSLHFQHGLLLYPYLVLQLNLREPFGLKLLIHRSYLFKVLFLPRERLQTPFRKDFLETLTEHHSFQVEPLRFLPLITGNLLQTLHDCLHYNKIPKTLANNRPSPRSCKSH